MGLKKSIFLRLDASIIEFIDNNLLKMRVNGIVIERTRPEVLRDIFMVGWENYNYGIEGKEEKNNRDSREKR